MISRHQAKRMLKDRGWSYRSAAPELGVHYSHLCLVLTGKRESRRLLNAIAELPRKEDLPLMFAAAGKKGDAK